MGVGEIFDIGRSGLTANQQAMQTSSNNIANSTTPGYSRQRAGMESRATGSSDGKMIGGGVDVKQVIRIHDDFVEKQILEESKNMGTFAMRAETLRHLESLLHTNGFEIGEQVNTFFNAFRELSVSPENSAVRLQVGESARSIAQSFRKTDDSLQGMKRDLDMKIEYMCQDINTKTKELGVLNDAIARAQYVKQPANELEDKRDMIVRELSQKLGFPIVPDERNQMNISSTGLGILVQGNQANELVTMRTAENGDKAAGNVDIFIKDPYGQHAITGAMKEGELAGLIYVRDKVINPTLERLDSAAFQITHQVNEIHKEGVGVDGKSERGIFRAINDGVKGSAGKIDLSDAVKAGPDAIASALSSAPGDNRIALRIADLQNKHLMPTDGLLKEGEGGEPQELHVTINESLNAVMGNVAAHVSREEQLAKHQELVMNQLDNYKQSISGVSLEEEAVNMIKHQAVFNASAKTMKVGDELLQTILSIKD